MEPRLSQCSTAIFESEEERTTIANDAESGDLARAKSRALSLKCLRVRSRTTIDVDDDVSPVHPGASRLAVGIDRAHDHSARDTGDFCQH